MKRLKVIPKIFIHYIFNFLIIIDLYKIRYRYDNEALNQIKKSLSDITQGPNSE